MSGSGENPGDGSAQQRRAREEQGSDLDRLAEDWITLWQSELTALAADPEWIGWSQQALALGAAWMRAMAAAATPPPPAAGARGPAWGEAPGWPGMPWSGMPVPPWAAAAAYHAPPGPTSAPQSPPGPDQAWPAADDGPVLRDATGPDGPPRPAPPAAASEPRGDAGMGGDEPAAAGPGPGARLDELERRLAALERGTRGGRADRPGARRRRPPA